MASFAVFVAFAAGLAASVEGNAFLGMEPHMKKGKGLVSKASVEQAFSAKLSTAQDPNIRRLEQELLPLFTSMPKNVHGKLEPSVTRYALHRYFARNHRWYVVGLEPAGGSWNSSSPGSVMKDRVPAFLASLFAERFQGQGLGLHELAVFAATLLDLVHSESLDDLQTVYASHGLSLSASLSHESLDSVMNDYVVMQFHSMDTASNMTLDLRGMEAELLDEFVSWEDWAMWARDLRRSVELEQNFRSPFGQPVSLDALAGTARELGNRFGAYLNLECQHIKNKLMDLEYKDTGRVRLSDYYSGASDESWNFLESVDYLRALGALDESNPRQPSVIIPNVLVSPSNCVTPSSYYSVCCLNECESLMSTLEQAIGGPTAKPAQIADVVAGLPSDTVEAPRPVKAAQLQRLEEIAAQHGGSVPLHGRLFAQWMHHMYPRECPFPHLSNPTNPISPDEWKKKGGDDVATEEELKQYTMRQVDLEESAASEELPWIAVEELVVSPNRLHQPRRFAGFGAFQAAGFLALLAATAMRTKQTSGRDGKPNFQSPLRVESYFV